MSLPAGGPRSFPYFRFQYLSRAGNCAISFAWHRELGAGTMSLPAGGPSSVFLFPFVYRSAVPSQRAGGESDLQVETARESVHIHHLAGKE